MSAHQSSNEVDMELRSLRSTPSSLTPAVSRVTTTSTAPSSVKDDSSRQAAKDDAIRHSQQQALQQLYNDLGPEGPISNSTSYKSRWPKLTWAKIRVLDITNIQEGSLTKGATPVIEARMRVIDLLNPSENDCFDAVSYRWNKADSPLEYRILLDPCTCKQKNQQRHISCSCKKFEVSFGQNAYSAIYHIYHQNKTQAQDKESKPLTIWLDELCINQKSREDQGMQIPLMGKIYSSAEKTYFWIGEGNQQSDRAMDYLRNGLLPRGFGPIRCALALLHRLVRKHWLSLNEGLGDIANRDWISRVWTFQECLLSRNGYIVCGNKCIPWMAMVKSVIFYKTVRQHRLAPSPPEAWHSWMDLVEYWMEFSQPHREGTGSSKSEHGRTQTAEKEIEQYRSLVAASWKYYQRLGALFAVSTVVWCCGVVGAIFAAIAATGGGNFTAIGAVGVVLMILVLIAWSRTAYLPEGNLGWIKIPEKEAVLHEILRRDCSNYGDKYYGVHALLDEETDVKKFRDEPQDLAKIYQHLTITLLRKDKCLNTLLVGLYLKSSKTASWVIDWSSVLHDCRATPAKLRGTKEDLYDSDSGICKPWIDTEAREKGEKAAESLRQAKSQDVQFMQFPLRYANLLGAGGLWLGFRFYEQSQWSWLRGPRYRQFVEFGGPTPGSVSKIRWEDENRKLVVSGCVVAKLKAVESNIPGTGLKLKDGRLEYRSKSQDDLELGVSAFQRVMRGLKPTQLNMCVKYLLMIAGSMTVDENVTAFAGQAAWLNIMTGRDTWSDTENITKAVRRLQRAGRFKTDAKARPCYIQDRLQGFMAVTGVALARCEGGLFSGLGIACPIARENDSLALISGVSLPMVLRPGVRGEYTVVGPAFFGGFMDGKVWNHVRNGRLEDITLI